MPAYGIDVSHYQKFIEWDDVAVAGKKFAIIKATEATGWVDDRFLVNRQRAREVGLKVGAYHFFRPGWNNVEQAQHFYRTTGPLQDGDLIPWVDVEDFHKTYNGQAINPQQSVKDLAETLVAMDKFYGVKVGIYTAVWCWNPLPVTWEMDRPLWVCDWTPPIPGNPNLPKGWKEWVIHQYSASGHVAGITGNTDLDYAPDLDAITYHEDAEGGKDQDVLAELAIIEQALASIRMILS